MGPRLQRDVQLRRRFGERLPKQYVEIHGRTVLEWALKPFVSDARCAGITLALAAGDSYWPQLAARGNVGCC